MPCTAYAAVELAREHLRGVPATTVVGVVACEQGWQVIGPRSPHLLVTAEGEVTAYDPHRPPAGVARR